MRILMLVQHPTARGPTPTLTLHLTRALRDLGHDVTTHHWGSRRPGESTATKLAERLADVLGIARAARRRPFDVALVHTSHDWRTLSRDIPAVLALRRSGAPIVLHFHGSDPPSAVRGRRLFTAASALLVSLVDAVLVLSTEEARGWRTFHPSLSVFVVKNPYERAAPPSPAETVRPAEGRILFVGRLLEQKGVLDLLAALPTVLEQVECELAIVGEGPAEAGIRRLAAELGVEGRVHLLGYLHAAAVAAEYRRATVFALPTWSEGFPTVLAEAMDAGLPIVTTGIRGAADHLRAGEHALFVEPRDVEGLATGLIALLTDAELRERMSVGNRERVELFAPHVVAAELVEVLEAVVNARRDRAPGGLRSALRRRTR